MKDYVLKHLKSVQAEQIIIVKKLLTFIVRALLYHPPREELERFLEEIDSGDILDSKVVKERLNIIKEV